MKLTQTAPGLVTVKLDARTKVDHRMHRLDTTPMLRKVLTRYGHPVKHADDGKLYAWDYACGEESCGATWNDRENHPAMYYDSRGASYPDGSPEFVVCTVCGFSRETASAAFERLCTKHRDKALDAWAITRLPMLDFTAIRCNGKRALGEAFRPTAELVAPKRIDLGRDVQATLIRACALSVASEAMKHASFPEEAWVTVPVTHDLWPKQRWHSQPMTKSDAAPIRRYQRQQRREAEAAIESEVAAFRDELAQRQRA
jgi:hypothetical protein